MCPETTDEWLPWSAAEPREEPRPTLLEPSDRLPRLGERPLERGDVLVRHAGLGSIEALVDRGVSQRVVREVTVHGELSFGDVLLVPQPLQLVVHPEQLP